MSHQNMSQNAQQLIASIDPALGRDRSTRDRVLRHLRAETGAGGRAEWPDIVNCMHNVIHTAEIRVQSDLVDGLRKSVATLEEHRRKGRRGWEGDQPLRLANLPQHVRLLLSLAEKPSEDTHNFARRYLRQRPRTGPTADELLYREIMSDPFEGDHWGKGWDEEVKEGWTDSESEETSDEEEIVTPSSRTNADPMARLRLRLDQRKADSDDRLQAAQATLQGLKENAYWRTGGREIGPLEEQPQGWRAISTGVCIPALCPELESSSATLIKVAQLQRELLFALSGKPGVLFCIDPDGNCQRTSHNLLVAQFSSESLSSIASECQSRATQLGRLRVFINETLMPKSGPSRPPQQPRMSAMDSPSRTKQAFAECSRRLIEDIENWVAEQECHLVRGRPSGAATPLPVTSPLQLLRTFGRRFGLVLDHLTGFLSHASKPIPLLDAIYAAIENTKATQHARGSVELVFLFIQTAAPMWDLLGEWLTRGMPISNAANTADSDFIEGNAREPDFDAEFFIHRDLDVAWSDEDFWESAWVDCPDGWPSWLASDELRLSIYEAGKARGLLRSLGSGATEWERWSTLSDVLLLPCESESASIANTLSSFLGPRCQIATLALRRILDEECGLFQHLDAIEGILYGTAPEVAQEWSSWLCKQVHLRKRWADFQVLTGTLRDAIESAETGGGWLNPSAIRVHPIRRSDQSTAPEVMASIRATYSVPFPLSQVFTSTSVDLRADCFAFLLQIRRARDLLQRSRGVVNNFASSATEEARTARGVLFRLAWVIDVLWVWLNDRVIANSCLDFRSKLAETSSLGLMIRLELEHVRQIRELCFLHEKTSDMNVSVATVLEMTSKLHDALIALDDQKRQEQVRAPTPVGAYVQGRSRRRINRRRVTSLDTDSSDSDDDEETRSPGGRERDAMNATTGEEVSFALLSFEQQMVRLNEDLGDHVAVIKNGAESLSSPVSLATESEGRVAEIWGMLGTMLDDWK